MEDFIKEINTIFEHNNGVLGIDEDSNLYWNNRRVITEQKVTLQRWVNVAIILASNSSVALAMFAALEFLGYGAK